MKNYKAPEFQLVETLDNYCAGSIEIDNVSSQTAGNGGIHQVADRKSVV